MNEPLKELAGIMVAVIFTIDGLMHLYWATGNIWPASNKRSLIQAVLNVNVSFGPQITIPLACLLFGGALTVLARVHRLGKPGRLIPDALLQLGTLVVAAGLLLRSVAGIVWILGLGADPGTLFYKLNLIVYTPVCLVLFAAAVFAARTERSHRLVVGQHV